jgi:hypothetical protein
MTEYEKQQKFMQEYGKVKVRFTKYYKYTFTFVGEHNGNVIVVNVGGNSEEIYRQGVESDTDYEIYELQPYAGKVTSVDGELFSFYNY